MIEKPFVGQLVKCPDGYVGRILEVQNDRRVIVEVTRTSAWDRTVLEEWSPDNRAAEALTIFKNSLANAGFDKDQVNRAVSEIQKNRLLIRERT